jgi:hypothetical protein
MSSTFTRVRYQVAVSIVGTTVDLIPRITATQRLVLSRVRIVNTKPLGTRGYIFRIPPTGSEGENTSILYGTPVKYGKPFDEHNIVLEASEGLAVAALCVGAPLLVFTAFGELETIS